MGLPAGGCLAFAGGGRLRFYGAAPVRALSGPSTAIAVGRVALLCALMQERSSVADLANQLRSELDRYSPGGKLPSSRALVDRFRVSPVTVSRALAQLAAEGLVVTCQALPTSRTIRFVYE